MIKLKIPACEVKPGDICGFGSRVITISHNLGDPRLDVLLEKRNGERFWTDWKSRTTITVRRPEPLPWN